MCKHLKCVCNPFPYRTDSMKIYGNESTKRGIEAESEVARASLLWGLSNERKVLSWLTPLLSHIKVKQE